MKVITKTIHVSTKGENDMLDVTEEVSTLIGSSKLSNGIATVFVSGSTSAITTMEYEPSLRQDFPKMLARIAPERR
jgi:thiamine phosphate synthase YjbQ (UPF0047 family)